MLKSIFHCTEFPVSHNNLNNDELKLNKSRIISAFIFCVNQVQFDINLYICQRFLRHKKKKYQPKQAKSPSVKDLLNGIKSISIFHNFKICHFF